MSWVTLAAASPLIRKIENGTSGVRARRSLATKAARSAAAAASPLIVSAVPQPISGARTSA